jgi:hypothetical protein
MRWILLLVALGAFVLAFSTNSEGLMGFLFVLGFGALFAAVLAFAQEKIASTARPDAALLTDKDISALRASMHKPATPASSPPPSSA